MRDIIHNREKITVNNLCHSWSFFLDSFLAIELELAYPVAGEP